MACSQKRNNLFSISLKSQFSTLTILSFNSIKTLINHQNTLKLFFLILWETKSLDNKKYLIISEKINEIGRMLGGWLGQITKQNSPAKR